MPDPLLYLQGMAAATIVSALVVLVAGWRRRSMSLPVASSVCLLAIGSGVVLGCYLLRLQPGWPPLSALDRFLAIVLPAVITIEWIASVPQVPRWLAWLLRFSLAVATGRILLHGSIYLGGDSNEWTLVKAAAVLAVCSLLLAVVWVLLERLFQRAPGVSIPLALAMSIITTGMAIMLAGYLKGGVAALPLAASLAGATVAVSRTTIHAAGSVSLGVGVVGLFGLLFIGLFFGRLSVAGALAVLLAPLLCWATELRKLRDQKPWIVGSVRLLLVAIPLAIMLLLAKRHFDRHTAPLLTIVRSTVETQLR